MEQPENIGKMIATERVRRGLSQHDLAKAVRLSQPAIAKIEDGTTKQSKHLWQIMGYLGLPMPEAPKADPRSEVIPESKILQRGQTFPVYVSVEGGPGEVIRSAEPADWIPRPTQLANVRNAYGLIVVGESMLHRYRPGDIALVNPNLPVLFDEVYIFYHENAEGEARATIKHLVRSTADAWVVKQFNPEKQFSLKKSEWAIAHRVVGNMHG